MSAATHKYKCKIFAGIFSILIPLYAIADPNEEEQENKLIIASAKPANDDPEVYTLDTWKSNVRGSFYGDKLINMLSHLNSSIVRNHCDLNALYTRGHLYGTIGCTNAAIIDLTKVIQTDPQSSNSYCERGICYLDLGEYDKALKDLNKSVELNPQLGDAKLARGRVLLYQGKTQEALNDLISARNDNLDFNAPLPGELPSNYYKAPDYYLGTCYELLGKYNDALRHYKLALELPSATTPGYLHRYADQPIDTEDRISRLNLNSNSNTKY